MSPKRYYRNLVKKGNLCLFQVAIKETDIHIQSDKCLKEQALNSLLKHRNQIEEYIKHYPKFQTSFKPWMIDNCAYPIISEMAIAGGRVGVGPMAAVAGVLAEYVGRDLLKYSKEVIVENGGDIFIKSEVIRKVGIFAGKSPLSNKIILKVNPEQTPLGICTSSGTVGHSFSFGRADAVCILSKSTALADAAATAVGNIIRHAKDIQTGLDICKGIDGILGVVIIIGKQVGLWGEIELEN